MAAEIDLPNPVLSSHLVRSRQLGYQSLAAMPARLSLPLSLEIFEDLSDRRKKVGQLEREVIVPNEEVSERVAFLGQYGQLQPTLRQVLDFLVRETILLQPLTQLGFDSVVKYFFNIDQVAGIPIAWNRMDLRSDGAYNHDEGILMKFGPPLPESLLISLARTGLVDNSSLILTHELVHSKQAARKKKRGEWYKKHREFMEVHAYISEGRAQYSDRGRLKKHILTAVGYDKKLVYPGADPFKIMFAIWAVDRLLALGFTHNQICDREANLGNWNQRRSVYGRFSKTIASSSRRFQLSSTNLDGLVEGNDLILREHRSIVRLIAQEELKKAA
ncbi:hypothetical protein HYS93_00810 [Candidatus Daviesbacteria bacterium]|nr:hypothetical protein [Candidatus Daviesbacteria bacterium]